MDPALLLFLSLLFAHLLADFVLQSDRDVARKTRPLIFAKHVAIVTFFSWGLAGDWCNWLIPLVIALTHACLDAGKLILQRRGMNPARLFIWDQLAHLAVILGLAFFEASRSDYRNALSQTLGEFYGTFLIIGAGFIITVQVGGLLIGMASARFLEQIKPDPGNESSPQEGEELRVGLRDGGRVIGQLERALIFFFVLIGKPEAVAFLVAAKSVFRFGELTKHSRKEAEYILIGTLMSFSWGLFIAWGTHYLNVRF